MSVWYEGTSEIDCDLRRLEDALGDLGALDVGIISLMPGMTSVVLVEQGSDFVTIKTNEGLMRRTNISKQVDAERIAVELDEEYEAGSKVTTTSHFSDEFTTSDTGVTHRLVIGDVTASGFLGFFYRTFGNSKMGNAFLTANKTYFEQQAD